MPNQQEKAAITNLIFTVQHILDELVTLPEKFEAGVSTFLAIYLRITN